MVAGSNWLMRVNIATTGLSALGIGRRPLALQRPGLFDGRARIVGHKSSKVGTVWLGIGRNVAVKCRERRGLGFYCLLGIGEQPEKQTVDDAKILQVVAEDRIEAGLIVKTNV